MLLAKDSTIRFALKNFIRSFGSRLVSFSERISYSPMHTKETDGRWIICTREGIEWKLDATLGVDSAIYRTGMFEPDSTRRLHELVNKGMVIADVGANFGYYTILCSKIVGNAGKVFAFEPSRKFRERLVDHIRRNNCTNVDVIGEGLSNKKETRRLFVGGDSASLYYWGSDARNADWEQVDFDTFDAFVRREKIERLDFVKVDIDGHEIRFLEGAKKSLRTMKPVILIECNQLSLQKAGSDVDDLFAALRSLGYEFRSEKDGQLFKDDDALFREAKNCAYSVNIICTPHTIA